MSTAREAHDRRATRVADAHHQARRTLAASAGFVVAAAGATVVPHDTGSWLPLHLLLVGGLLTAISGATQLLAITWSTAPAPQPRLAAAQRGATVAGAALVVVGREADQAGVTGTGASLVVAGLVLLAVILVGVRRTSATDRFLPAIEAYLAAIAFGIVGVGFGAAIATGDPASWWPRLRDAHLVVNVFGLVGLVIAGTLPFFVATQVRMKMSPRATSGRVRGQGGLLAVATLVAALGHLAEQPTVAGTGLLAYAAGLIVVVTSLPVPGRRQLDWAGARLLQLAAGVAWWVVTTVILAVGQLVDDPMEGPVLRALAVGGFAQILVASLAYFGPVLRGGGHERLSAGFATTRSWIGLVVANVAAIALLIEADRVAAAAAIVWAVDTLVRAVRLLGGGRMMK